MDSKKGIIIAVCVVIIVVALGITIKRQMGSSGPPDYVLDRESKYTCAKCGVQQTLKLRDVQALAIDDATGYRKCPKCGDMGLAAALECPHCHAVVPVAPQKVGAEPPATPEAMAYKCPKCGKDVNAPPAEMPK